MGTESRGFTILEVLIALFLMGMTLIAAAPLFVLAVRVNASGADLGSVGAIAVDRLELLRASDFFELPAGGSLTSDVSGYSDLSNPGFTVRWQIVNNATPTTIKTISARAIANRQVMGLQKEITVSTLRAR